MRPCIINKIVSKHPERKINHHQLHLNHGFNTALCTTQNTPTSPDLPTAHYSLTDLKYIFLKT